ncbi:MAG: HMA2 domain-containing protein [Spirulina sp.]
MTETALTNGIPTIPNETTEQHLAAFLKEHQEVEMIVPVVIGVLVTSRFQLRGAKALLVNLLVASVTRQVFAQLKKMGGNEMVSPPLAATGSNGNEAEEACSLLHFIPGRIRLRVPRIHDDRHFASSLEQHLTAEANVTSVRMNQVAGCVTIAYESNGKSDLAMSSHLTAIIQNKDSEYAG